MYFSIRFLSLVCLLSQSTVVFRLSEASKDVGFKRQVFENVVTEVECCKCKEKIRVNPYDMLNYVHGAKTMRGNNEKPSNFNGESCPQTDTIQVQSRLYLQRFVNQLLLASGLKDSRLDSGHKIVHMELNISYVELKLMHEFANTGTVTLERIDGILSRILRPKNVKSVHKGSGFLSDIDFVYYSKVVWATLATVPFDYPMVGIACFVSIVFIITVRHMRRYTLFYSMVLMLFIIFCSGFGWNWLRMIKEEEAKIASTYALHLKQLPIHCRPHDMTWYQRIWYHSYEKDCEKYFKEISIDPVVRISPTLVLSETLTMVLLHPAGKIGSAFGEFLAALIDPIPFAHKWYLVPLMLILLFSTGFLTYVVLIGGVISFRTLLCSFEIGRRDRSTRHMVEDMRQARRMIEEVRHEEDGGGRRIEGGGGGREIEGGRDWRIEGGGSDREGGSEGGSYSGRGIDGERRGGGERRIEGGGERRIEEGGGRERGVEGGSGGGRRIEGKIGGEKGIIGGGSDKGRGMDEERGIGERSERERGIGGEKRIDNWRTPGSGRVRILENSERGVGSGRKRIEEDIKEENEWREIGWRIAGNVGKGERGTPENERLVRGERSGSGRRKFLEEGGERGRRLMDLDDEGEEEEWRTAEKGGGSSVRRRIGEGVERGRRDLDEGGSGDSLRRKGRGGIWEESGKENEEEEERKHEDFGSSYEGVCEKCGSEGRKTKGNEKYVSGKVREEDEEKGGGEGKKCIRRLVEERGEERESWERRIDQKKSENVVKRRSKMADYERVLTDDEEEEKEERGGEEEEEEEEEEDNLNKNFSPRAFEELKSIYKRFRKIVAKEDTDSSEMSSPDISGFERIEK